MKSILYREKRKTRKKIKCEIKKIIIIKKGDLWKLFYIKKYEKTRNNYTGSEKKHKIILVKE